MTQLIEALEVKKDANKETLMASVNILLKKSYEFCEQNELFILDSDIYIEELTETTNVIQLFFNVSSKS